MYAATVQLNLVVFDRYDFNAVVAECIPCLVRYAFRHYDAARAHSEAVDDPSVVIIRHLDGLDAQLLESFKKRERQAARPHQGQIDVDHQEMPVNVDVIAAQIDDDQLNALIVQHFCNLCDAIVIVSDAASNNGCLAVQPGKAAPFRHGRAMQGAQYRHAKLCQGPADRQLLAMPHPRGKPGDNRTALDGKTRIAGIDRLESTVTHAVQIDDLHAFRAQGIGKTVMLFLQLRK